MNRVLSLLVSLTTATALAAEEPKPRTDLYGDPLPPGAVLRYGTIRLRHESANVAFLKDGKRIISCGHDGEMRIWDVATGKQSKSKRLFPSEMSSTIVASALSRGGEIYSVWDGKTVYLYDTNTGKERGRITPVDMPRRFLIVTFSPDGKLLGLQRPGEGSSYQVEIWNVSDFKKLQTIIIPHELKLSSLVFRWDGKQLAGMAEKDDGTGKLGGVLIDLFLWDAASGKRIGTRNNLRRVDPDSLAFSPDGQFLAATIRKPSENDPLFNEVKGLSLIEVSSGQEVHRLPFEAMGLASLTFTKDGRGLLAAFLPSSVDKQGMLESPKLRVWDTVTGALRQEREWPENIASKYNESRSLSLLALPGGGVATAMNEGDILVWDWGLSPKQAHKPERDLGRAELETVWSDLSADAHKAYRAVEKMTSAPAQTLPFFRDHLRPATAKDPVIDKLIVDLESDSFEQRQASTRNLTRLHYRAEPMLRRVLRDKPSLEMRRRIEAILTEPRIPQANDLRNLRAITVLERIGTPEARRVLEKLAGGADAPETRAAKAALVRLQHRSSSETGRTSP